MPNLNRLIEAQLKRGHPNQATKRQLLKRWYSIKAVAEMDKKLPSVTVRIMILDASVVIAAGATMFSVKFVNLYINSFKYFSKGFFSGGQYIWLSLTFLLILLPVSTAHLPFDTHVEFVNVSSSGFTPDFLTVEQGTTVVWTVEDDGFYWPASNLHPTHDAYPESNGCIGSNLDACRGLKKGENYNFAFDMVGMWGIHDHLHSGFTMTIEVVGDPEDENNILDFLIMKTTAFFGLGVSIKNGIYDTPSFSAAEYANLSVDWCITHKNKYKIVESSECYARQMENISFNYGRDFAYDVLFEIQKIDPAGKTCHFITHGIGWGLYKRTPEDWQKLVIESRSECSYGEQMGTIEYYTQKLQNGKITKELVPELCGENPKANCNHAVGHMMLLETENNLSEAIELCYGLENENQRYHCLNGAFMERIAATNLAEHGFVPKNWTYSNMKLRINESETLCLSYKGNESVACWREMAHPIAQFYNGYIDNQKKTFNRCNTAPTLKAAWECKTHAIGDLASSKRFNLTILKPMCELQRGIDPKFESYCYRALVSSNIRNVGGQSRSWPEDYFNVIDFCNSLPTGFNETCFSSIERSLKDVKAIGTNLETSNFVLFDLIPSIDPVTNIKRLWNHVTKLAVT